MLVSCLAYSSTLMIEAIRPSETPVDFYRATWRYIPEDRTFHNRRCEKFTKVITELPCREHKTGIISLPMWTSEHVASTATALFF
jgi:hypothetical protein